MAGGGRPGDTTPIRFVRKATDTRLALTSRPSPVPCAKPRQISDKLRFRALDSDGGTVRASGTIPRHPIPRWFRFSPNGGSASREPRSWVTTRRELFCVPSSPQRAILAVPSATPTAGSVQNQPICRAPFLVPFVLTLQGSHFQAHTSCTTSTSLV